MNSCVFNFLAYFPSFRVLCYSCCPIHLTKNNQFLLIDKPEETLPQAWDPWVRAVSTYPDSWLTRGFVKSSQPVRPILYQPGAGSPKAPGQPQPQPSGTSLGMRTGQSQARIWALRWAQLSRIHGFGEIETGPAEPLGQGLAALGAEGSCLLVKLETAEDFVQLWTYLTDAKSNLLVLF